MALVELGHSFHGVCKGKLNGVLTYSEVGPSLTGIHCQVSSVFSLDLRCLLLVTISVIPQWYHMA